VSCPVSTKYYTPVVDSHLGECLNYRVFRCGDGLINGRNGSTKYDNGTFTEACDPNAPGWSRTTCDPQTCQPINEPQGNGSIEKTLIGDGIVTKTGDIVTWKITVTASGGSIKDFEIKDKLPAELAYESYVPFKVPSGITVNPPTGTTTKIITWKVDGTLKEGETIELEVITKVVKMPVYNQKVENVACLVIAGREECDPGYIGTPSIEKTLI
jgi:fimbrial isopeptide formation D2 family protein